MNEPTEIRLHLLRHAHAGDPMRWRGPDEFRPLTEKGRQQSERLGAFLARSGFRPDAILTSPLTRAVETAQLVGAALEMPAVVVNELGGALDFETIEAMLRNAGNPHRPVLVGHDPDFSLLAAELSGATDLPVRKATLVRIDVSLPLQAGAGILRWLLPPDLLGTATEMDR